VITIWIYFFQVFKKNKDALKRAEDYKQYYWLYDYNEPSECKVTRLKSGKFGMKYKQ
jgi:hypothetical protein